MAKNTPKWVVVDTYGIHTSAHGWYFDRVGYDGRLEAIRAADNLNLTHGYVDDTPRRWEAMELVPLDRIKYID